MRKQYCESGSRTTSDKKTANTVATGSTCKESFDVFLLPLRILPLGSLCEVQDELGTSFISLELVGRFGWQEGQFGCDAAWAGRAAEEAAQLTQAKSIHGLCVVSYPVARDLTPPTRSGRVHNCMHPTNTHEHDCYAPTLQRRTDKYPLSLHTNLIYTCNSLITNIKIH